ncbi:MAG: ribonuclease R [Alphaproteobacteria bacterium]
MSFLTKEAIFAFIKDSSKPLTKREIARAFSIKGGENRVALKQILKALEKDGSLSKQAGGTYSAPDGLPSVGVLEIHEIDEHGDVFARPLDWDEDLKGAAPRIEIIPDNKNFRNCREGSRALCRLSRVTDNAYEGRIIRLVDEGSRYEGGSVMGIVRLQKKGAILQPTHKKAKYDFDISIGDLNGAKEGDLASAEVLPSRGLKRKRVRVTSVIGKQGDPKAISLISLHEAGLNDSFPQKVLDDAEGLEAPPLKGREDLRKVPLVTIDGADARDFDDAVFAEKLKDGSYHLIVAIADVAHYVRHGSALDNEAQRRGNSTYFPDRVVPMLPEALSNDLCSLRPNEVRASLAVHMWVDKDGKLLRYKFVRALIKSAARLIYEQVQAARDGQTDDTTGPLMEGVINPLYDAYEILNKARQNRGALDLDLPEKKIVVDDKGNMTGVETRARFDAHKLIEEFMILANVAAASALEDKNGTQKGVGDFPCVYRIHDKPSSDKIENNRAFIESFDLSFPKGQVIQPKQINYLLQAAAKLPYSHLISQMILRTQSQAVYSTQNIGHFGLALTKYAHFTSPIRRYADLLVHRALIGAYKLGDGGLTQTEKARIEEISEHISGTERTSMEAERNAVDRFTAAFLSSHIGAEFDGTISGVTRFGLFVALKESGADGLIPMKALDNDFYVHDEKAHALIGRRHEHVYRMGAPIRVVIKEADGIKGSCSFTLAPGQKGADIPGMAKPKIPPGDSHGGHHAKRKYGKKKPGHAKYRGKNK